MHRLNELLNAMVAQHAALALPTDVDAACPVQAASASDEPRALAYAAARRLGFIEADARCVAQAWQRQSERMGQFDAALWPVHAQDFGLGPWPREGGFAPCPHALGLYAVLPSAEWVGRMARAGVPTLQLRFKSPDPAAVRTEVQRAVEAVRGTESLLFINDHWRVALEAGAYGVHLGQEDLDTLHPQDLETLRSAGVRLGLSTHGYAEMCRADAVGPSYIAMGAVFPTTLKAMPTAPQGLGRLGAYAALMHQRPVVAIGGIGLEHLPAVAATGVGSFAVVRAITAAPDPEAAAAELAQTFAAAQASAAKK